MSRYEIVTVYDYPPIPDRLFDWCAWIDGEEDGRIGHGRTESAAVFDLMEQIISEEVEE